MTLSMGFRSLVSLLPAIQATRRLALASAGLTPAERASLRWTHNPAVNANGLPPNTDFDFFVIQQPNGPFGMSWYQGDIDTDENGEGHGKFVGRFSIETFVVAPGSVDAPLTFEDTPNPSVSPNPKTG